MNQNAEQLWCVLLEANFQFGLNVVDAGQRKVVGERAMTRDVHTAPDALNNEVVDIEDFGELRGHGFQSVLEFRIADDLFGLFDGGGHARDWGGEGGECREMP